MFNTHVHAEKARFSLTHFPDEGDGCDFDRLRIANGKGDDVEIFLRPASFGSLMGALAKSRFGTAPDPLAEFNLALDIVRKQRGLESAK